MPAPPSLPPYRQRRPAYTTPRPWAPLTEAEWSAIGGHLAALGCGMSFGPRPGRPPQDVRARLDAIFRAVTLKAGDGGRASWRALPEEFGKPDTVSRTFRRWARQGLWQRLLIAAADPALYPELRGLRYFICCAFRRATRIIGIAAALLARRLGLYSALPSPPWCLPDRDLSELYKSYVAQAFSPLTDDWPAARRRDLLRSLSILGRLLAGRRIQRVLEPA